MHAGDPAISCSNCLTPLFNGRIGAGIPQPCHLAVVGDDLPVSAAGLCLQRIAPDGETRTRDWTADIAGGKLPTVLDGVGVMVNGKPAYIGYISPKQINILTPADATTGPVQIQTTNNGLTSGTVTATMQATSPAFFLFAGGKYIAARHAD